MTKNAKNNVNGDGIAKATGSWMANGRLPTAKNPNAPPIVIIDANKAIPSSANCQFSIFFTLSGSSL